MDENDDLMELVEARQGHFLLESGHHGELWLDLELLCLAPRRVRPMAVTLARQLTRHSVDAICGPLVEGAFIALLVAEELGLDFFYTEPRTATAAGPLYPRAYELPVALRSRVAGKHVAIVNDVINAGSAVRGTYTELTSQGARVPAVATLLTLGETFQKLAETWKVELISLASRANPIWVPDECPLCARGLPLTRVESVR